MALEQHAEVSGGLLKNLKNNKRKPLSIDGIQEGQWVLMDFGHVVVHIFYDPVRNFYDLEGLWNEAARLVTPGLEKFAAAMTDPEDTHA